MSEQDGLFELTEFAPPAPEWAAACRYCRPDPMGHYDKQHHDRGHLPITCAVCGTTSPNRLLANMNHVVSLGASYKLNKLVCLALSLWLNHLTWDRLNNTPFPEIGDPQLPQDWRALQLGWTIGPAGEQIAPPNWPDASHATKCELIEKD